MKLDNIAILLVNPKFPGNIGAVSRAMKTMGVTDLRLVSPSCSNRDKEAVWMAHGAEEVLKSARNYRTLKTALRGRHVAVGTTNRHRQGHSPSHTLREFAEEISRISERNRIAILFGREDKGLLNEHLDECDLILTIPQSVRYPSLNLAQAVMLVCYELHMAAYDAPIPSPLLASRSQLERMYSHIRRTLSAMGYAGRKGLPDRIVKHIGKIFGRTTLTPTESNMVRGLCTAIEKQLTAEKQEHNIPVR
jgi:TrmH family RNA methyltransferase